MQDKDRTGQKNVKLLVLFQYTYCQDINKHDEFLLRHIPDLVRPHGRSGRMLFLRVHLLDDVAGLYPLSVAKQLRRSRRCVDSRYLYRHLHHQVRLYEDVCVSTQFNSFSSFNLTSDFSYHKKCFFLTKLNMNFFGQYCSKKIQVGI